MPVPARTPRYAVESATATTAVVDGREMLVFAGCNYLGLAHEPRVQEAAIKGLRRFGLSTSASRETTGNTLAHDELERRLARLEGTEDCVVVPDGYLANLAACQALRVNHEVAVIDERSHRSVHDAAKAAGFHVALFHHRDVAHAAELVRTHAVDAGVVIMSDGVFTADGALAPAGELVRHAMSGLRNVRLLLDDCHGLGTLGPQGRGILAFDPEFGGGDAAGTSEAGPTDGRILVTGTLAKGIGCHGGFIACDRGLAGLLRTGASAYVCVTPVSPGLACGALASLDILRNEPQRLERLRENQRRMSRGMHSMGLAIIETPAPIFAFARGAHEEMLSLHQRLWARGILAPYIRYPGGPAPMFFRLIVSSEHTPEQIDRLLAALREELAD
jgi:8-amino-7-oxononanoate synthase